VSQRIFPNELGDGVDDNKRRGLLEAIVTRLQPAYVENVAEAIVRAAQRTETNAITFECGGPRVYTFEEILRAIAREAGLKRILIPVPFAAWQALAFGQLGISPHGAEETLQEILRRH
jgi:NADH dehydrogenase